MSVPEAYLKSPLESKEELRDINEWMFDRALFSKPARDDLDHQRDREDPGESRHTPGEWGAPQGDWEAIDGRSAAGMSEAASCQSAHGGRGQSVTYLLRSLYAGWWRGVASDEELSLGSKALLKLESMEKIASAWGGLASVVSDHAFLDDLQEDHAEFLRMVEVLCSIESRFTGRLFSLLALLSAGEETATKTGRDLNPRQRSRWMSRTSVDVGDIIFEPDGWKDQKTGEKER